MSWNYLRFFFFLVISMVGELCASPIDVIEDYFKVTQDTFTVTKLQGGLSGAENYKVSIEGKDYVLRVLNPAESAESRAHEIAAATYAGELGIGPCIYYKDPEHNSMIMDFVQGQTLNSSTLKERDKLLSFLQTLRRLHDSKRDFPLGCTVFERIRIQLERLQQSEIPAPTDSIKRALNKLKFIEEIFKKEPLVPCHNDLNALNVIIEETTIKFIDWTDSGMGHSYNDLGYFLLVNGIEDKHDDEILELYLGRQPSEEELQLLKIMKKVNMLRIFASNFPAYEIPIQDKEQRALRKTKLEQMLWDPESLPLSYFFDLHMKGQLSGRETVIDLSLSALRSFLDDVSK